MIIFPVSSSILTVSSIAEVMELTRCMMVIRKLDNVARQALPASTKSKGTENNTQH